MFLNLDTNRLQPTPHCDVATPRIRRGAFLSQNALVLMKTVLIAILSLATLPSIISAQQATGIKSANLVGADLNLMNNHDPASELENFESVEDLCTAPVDALCNPI